MSWIQTYTGLAAEPHDLTPEQICIEDIAHALSQQCRFTGHTRRFYSVAEHSVRVSDLLQRQGNRVEVQILGLLHDASEAYVVDLPRPLKELPEFAAYRKIESAVLWRILTLFSVSHLIAPGYDVVLPDEIKQADNILLATEKRDLLGPEPRPWQPLPETEEDEIVPWSPEEAKRLFLLRFQALSLQRESCLLIGRIEGRQMSRRTRA